MKSSGRVLRCVPGLAAVLVLTCCSAGSTVSNRIEVIDVNPAPRGPWVAIDGTTWPPGIRESFLLDTASGRTVRLGGTWSRSGPERVPEATFSRDGRVAAWPEEGDPATPKRVHVLRLDASDATKHALTTKHSGGMPLALSPNGRLVAVSQPPQLVVVDVGTDSVRRRLEVPPGGRNSESSHDIRLDDAGTIRLMRLSGTQARTHLELLTAAAGDATFSIATIAPPEASCYLMRGWPISDTRFIVHWSVGRRRVYTLHDMADARLITRLVDVATHAHRAFGALADGRVLVALVTSVRGELRVFSTDGILERRVHLPATGSVSIVGERAPGEVVVGIRWNEQHQDELVVVDVNGDGKVLQRMPWLASVRHMWDPGVGSLPDVGVGSLATRLYWDTTDDEHGIRGIVILDWKTGQHEDVLAPRAW